MKYFLDSQKGFFSSEWKKISKKEFEVQRKKMLDEFGCEAIATLSNNETGKVEAKILCFETLKSTGIRGV